MHTVHYKEHFRDGRDDVSPNNVSLNVQEGAMKVLSTFSLNFLHWQQLKTFSSHLPFCSLSRRQTPCFQIWDSSLLFFVHSNIEYRVKNPCSTEQWLRLHGKIGSCYMYTFGLYLRTLASANCAFHNITAAAAAGIARRSQLSSSQPGQAVQHVHHSANHCPSTPPLLLLGRAGRHVRWTLYWFGLCDCTPMSNAAKHIGKVAFQTHSFLDCLL